MRFALSLSYMLSPFVCILFALSVFVCGCLCVWVRTRGREFVSVRVLYPVPSVDITCTVCTVHLVLFLSLVSELFLTCSRYHLHQDETPAKPAVPPLQLSRHGRSLSMQVGLLSTVHSSSPLLIPPCPHCASAHPR